MQRGFLDKAGYGGESEHLAVLRSSLELEEEQLRCLRQHRLQLESSTAEPPAVDLPSEAPDEVAMKALALHEEPPSMLHRLAVAVMLLLEAPFLVDLGDHSLPSRVPWRNLQLLLRKEKGANQKKDGPMKEILAAMQRSPFNERLARHVKQRILGGDPPVTRADILEHDPNCVVLFDWVSNLLTPLVERTSNKTWEIVELPELKEKREKAAEAVGEQEKKVAQLRRKLREAVRSEQAAADFAAQNRPGNVSTNKASGLAEKGIDPGDELVGHQTDTKSETVQLEVTGQKSLQYRLEEVEIPSTQQAILQSLVKTLMEPRGIHRRLEIVGHCEDRESDDVAQRRAAAAEAWMLEAGIPAARFTVSWEVGGPSLCRRTDFRLLDIQGSDALMKRKAEDVMKRIFSAHLQREETPEVEEMRVQEKPDPDVKRNSQHPDVKTLPPKLPEPQGVAPEPVNTAEVDAVTGSGDCGSPPNVKLEVSGQQVCLVFTKDGLSPQDALLDVGTKIVRLASLSGSWPEKEVTLPFDVQPQEPAAKFSRRAGTLTLTLVAK